MYLQYTKYPSEAPEFTPRF